jgi:hypothetical protein
VEEIDLFRPLRHLYWWSLGLAVLAHAALIAGAATATRSAKDRAAEPAKVRFFTRRDPLLARPLELRKVPQPKRQLVRRKVQASEARLDQVRAAAAFDTREIIARQGSGANAVALPGPVDRGPQPALEPGLAVQSLGESRAVENRIDMALEMLDVNSMDTGRYRAMVIQDAQNRQNLKGFVRLAQVMSASAVSSGTTGWGNIGLGTIDALRDALNEYTGLHADFIGSIAYDDERLMEVPIVIPQGMPNESEMAQLAKYLLVGGFVLGGLWDGYLEEALEKYGGLVRGRDFWSERLPDEHSIFSAFFDIKAGVPGAGSADVKWYTPPHLNGYFIKNRLAGVSSFEMRGFRYQQMAINVIIYALTQEGSITQRLMQMVH